MHYDITWVKLNTEQDIFSFDWREYAFKPATKNVI